MTFETMQKNVSLKNSIILAKMLYDKLSDLTAYKSFVEEMNKYKHSESMQKYIWNRELDRTYRKLANKDKELRDIAIKTMCTDSDSLELLDSGIMSRIRSQQEIRIEAHTFERFKKHIYVTDTHEVVIHANEEFEIHKCDLVKLLLERKYFGVMSNAKIKTLNVTFANGIDNPYDILNKIIFK